MCIRDRPDAVSRVQLQTLDDNCESFDVVEIPLNDVRQGIVHVMGPEQGAVLPGMTVVCGDSHTSTHGAAGALAQGIGTSEVEHVMATQCLIQRKMKNFRVEVTGRLAEGATAKDIALAVIGEIGTAGGTGFAIECTGTAIRELTMEGRMTLCNMAIEAGARCGLVAVDEVTLDYFRDKPLAPKGAQWDAAEAWWRTLHSDEGAVFDRSITLDGDAIAPHVTWGTSPEMVTSVHGRVPTLAEMPDETARLGLSRALEYMGLEEGMAISEIKPDAVFIGSCTNSRIEDLRAAARVLEGRKVAPSIRKALVVPGWDWSRLRQRPRGWIAFLLRPGWSGVSPVARCVWRCTQTVYFQVSDVPAPLIVTLRADKAVVDARIWSARPWRRLPPWRATLCR